MRKEGNNSDILTKPEIDNANTWLLKFMQESLKTGSDEIGKLRNKLSRTHQIIVILSIIMFAVGILLLLAPLIEFFLTNKVEWSSIIAGGLGIIDLTALFLFKPVSQIRKITGDISQLTVTINSYQTQVSLRLLESDSTDRSSLGDAAEQISEISKITLELIKQYYEDIDDNDNDKTQITE